MQITVEYSAQLKRAAGTGAETIELADGATLNDLVAAVVAKHDDALQAILVGEGGGVHPSILVFVNDQQIRNDDNCDLTDGTTVAFLSPISGG